LNKKKNNICYFGIYAFDALSTPWFTTIAIKHISDWPNNNLTNIILYNASLHQLFQEHWDCHWLGVTHCGSYKDYVG